MLTHKKKINRKCGIRVTNQLIQAFILYHQEPSSQQPPLETKISETLSASSPSEKGPSIGITKTEIVTFPSPCRPLAITQWPSQISRASVCENVVKGKACPVKRSSTVAVVLLGEKGSTWNDLEFQKSVPRIRTRSTNHKSDSKNPKKCDQDLIKDRGMENVNENLPTKPEKMDSSEKSSLAAVRSPESIAGQNAVLIHLPSLRLKTATNTPEKILKVNENPLENSSHTQPGKRQVLDQFAYEIGSVVGNGKFGAVHVARRISSNEVVGIKTLDKSRIKGREKMVKREIQILQLCDHPNIVKMYGYFESPTRVFIVMEYIKSGDLLMAIRHFGKFCEPEAAKMVADATEAVQYLHLHNVVHRDVKPENLLVTRSQCGELGLKLADFGLAIQVFQPITTLCGTPTYMAPEMLVGKGYDVKVDNWAIGIITYILLCGYSPFQIKTRNQSELFELIKIGCVQFRGQRWDNISLAGKNFVTEVLITDPEKRLSTFDMLLHPWLQAFPPKD